MGRGSSKVGGGGGTAAQKQKMEDLKAKAVKLKITVMEFKETNDGTGNYAVMWIGKGGHSYRAIDKQGNMFVTTAYKNLFS